MTYPEQAHTYKGMVVPTLEEVQYEQAQRHLYDFVRHSWHVFEPKTPFQGTRNLQCVCEHLEAVTENQIRDLVILTPPRTTKSTSVSVCWQPWAWIKYPHLRWLFFAYEAGLAIRDNVRSRNIIKSEWYQQAWADRYQLKGDQNEKGNYENSIAGTRQALGVNGAGTGQGGDIIGVDDPHNIKKIDSKVHREDGCHAWDTAISTRKNNPNTSHFVITMQRGHCGDLIGHMGETGELEDFTVLKLPMEAKQRTVITMPITGEKWVREVGDLLTPGRFDADYIAKLRRKLGSAAAAAQLDQEPTPQEGSIVKAEWLRYCEELPESFDYFGLSVDGAFEKGEENDYSAIGFFGVVKESPIFNRYYLLDMWRDKVEFPELESNLLRLYLKHNAWAVIQFGHKISKILIEKKASGHSLIQTAKRNPTFGKIIEAVKVDRDKQSRTHAATPIMEDGRFFLWAGRKWVNDCEDELITYPRSDYDDQLDVITQFINWYEEKPVTARPRARAIA